MKKEIVNIKPLVEFFLFLFGLLVVCIIGLSEVFALTYEDIGYLRDQTDMTIEVTYETESGAPLVVEQNEEIYTQIKAINLFVDNYTFNAGVHYQLEIALPNLILTNANFYEVYDQNNKSCNISNTYSIFGTSYPRWNFQCNNETNSVYIRISNNSNSAITEYGTFSWKSPYLRYTNAPIDSTDSENTDKIINNDNQNTDKIIESNKETQEVIKDQFSDCHDSVNLFNINGDINTRYSGSTGSYNTVSGNVLTTTFSSNNGHAYGQKIYVGAGNTVTLSAKVVGYIPDNIIGKIGNILLYNYGTTTGAVSNGFNVDEVNVIKSVTFTAQTDYIIAAFSYSQKNTIQTSVSFMDIQVQLGSTATKWEPYGEDICTNRIDETNDKLDNLQGALTDSSPTDMSNLGDSAGWLPAGPVDSILTLPLTMLNNLVTNLSNSCQTISIELPFIKEKINLPCVKSLYDKIGITGTLFTTAGLIASAFILFNYLLALYKWVDDTLTMRENTMPGYFDDNWGGGA